MAFELKDHWDDPNARGEQHFMLTFPDLPFYKIVINSNFVKDTAEIYVMENLHGYPRVVDCDFPRLQAAPSTLAEFKYYENDIRKILSKRWKIQYPA